MNALWNRFCDRFNIQDNAVPLFDVVKGEVQTTQIGKRSSLRPVLKRSSQMESLILAETDKLILDWQSGTHQYDGLIYMMGFKKTDQFLPLYIGKTETFGKGKSNLSVNIKNLHTDKSKFARWGDGYAYHVGDLSACVLNGHSDAAKTLKYQAWADCLFDGQSLKKPVYFWAMSWDGKQTGIWEDFGETNLSFLEYLLIGVASKISPDLLNKEGNARQK